MSYILVPPLVVLEAAANEIDRRQKNYEAELNSAIEEVQKKQFRFFGLIAPLSYDEAKKIVLEDYDYMFSLNFSRPPARLFTLAKLASLALSTDPLNKKLDRNIRLTVEDVSLLKIRP